MSGIGQPKKLTIDLSVALTEKEFGISGTQFGVWNSPLSSDIIQVRFNQNQAQQIPFARSRILAVPFNKVFISVGAGMTGDMDILYGHGSMDLFRIFPSVPEPFTSMETILNSINRELEGDIAAEGYGIDAVGLAAVEVIAANADRCGCSIQARWDNTGIIYVGFGDTVGPANYQSCLSAGDGYTWDDYRGPVFAEASVAAQEVGWGEW
ncbi:hypothetical protein LCGC14_0898790 [marine sediment metagenome]|uniref:Uncharacterized protein n=1 Tax=marine sediment metagenome TaxID=412755 RepID=A0A0F9NX04_9ZZZZ